MKKFLSTLAITFLILAPVAFAQVQEQIPPDAEEPVVDGAEQGAQEVSQPVAETPSETKPMASETSATTYDETDATAGETAGQELPKTASTLPLLVLLGGVAASGAAGLRLWRRAS